MANVDNLFRARKMVIQSKVHADKLSAWLRGNDGRCLFVKALAPIDSITARVRPPFLHATPSNSLPA